MVPKFIFDLFQENFPFFKIASHSMFGMLQSTVFFDSMVVETVTKSFIKRSVLKMGPTLLYCSNHWTYVLVKMGQNRAKTDRD
jgi:hypothetical protein